MTRHLATLGGELARAAAQPIDHRPDDEQQHRRQQQGEQRELDREAEQNDDVDEDDDDVLQQRRKRRAHGGLHLIRIADHPGDRLAGTRALEVAERQGLQVPEQTNAQVADDAFLNRDAAERREIGSEVLEQQRHQQHDDDVAERELR